MKLVLILMGRTDKSFVKDGFSLYSKRIKRYIPIEVIEIADPKVSKKLPVEEQKRKEGEEILKKIPEASYVVLLDESGKQYRSVEFAQWMQQKMNSGLKNLVFITGGAYGFSHEVRERADLKISLSPMTFSHQIIRIIFAEQLYRAFSIIHNEPYHNE